MDLTKETNEPLGGWDPVNRFNHTSRVAIVTQADRPKSVRNRCVIEVFGGVLCVVTLLFGFFCRCEGFCHRAESDLFLFSEIMLLRLCSCDKRSGHLLK